MTPLFTKLNLKAGNGPVVVLNAPASFDAELQVLAATGASVVREAMQTLRFALAFVVTQAELDAASKQLVAKAEGDAVLWMVYPKQSSKKYRCEFNRDSGWAILATAGYETVRMVAVDEDWSALRFRKSAFVKAVKVAKTVAKTAQGKAKAI